MLGLKKGKGDTKNGIIFTISFSRFTRAQGVKVWSMDDLLVKKQEKKSTNKNFNLNIRINDPSSLNEPYHQNPKMPQKKKDKEKKKVHLIYNSISLIPLGTLYVSARSTIVKVIPPHIINPSLYIIAIWVVC